jgi:hypothetical protein
MGAMIKLEANAKAAFFSAPAKHDHAQVASQW